MANEIDGSLFIPIFSVAAKINFGSSVTGRLNVSVPTVRFGAYGGGYLDIAVPRVNFTAQAHIDPVGRINIVLPKLCFSSNALQEGISYLNVTLPKVKFAAHGVISGIAELKITLPKLKFGVHGFTGILGQLNVEVPSLKFSASAYWTGTNTLNISLPMILFSTRAKGEMITLALNTKNFAFTEYDNSYNYNSLMNLNGKLAGLKSDGIYELTGDTDNGSSIAWHFKTGKIDMEDRQLNRLRHVWLSYRPSGDLLLVVDDGENEYEYDVESYKQIDNTVRVKLGKGIKNKYIQLELKNVSNEKIFLDRMRLFTESIAKKR